MHGHKLFIVEGGDKIFWKSLEIFVKTGIIVSKQNRQISAAKEAKN